MISKAETTTEIEQLLQTINNRQKKLNKLSTYLLKIEKRFAEQGNESNQQGDNILKYEQPTLAYDLNLNKAL